MKRNKESGQALLFMAMVLPVLIGMIGMVIDIGYARREKIMLQNACDAAAVAGALEVGLIDVTQAAISGAKENNVNDGVTVYYPPQDGGHVGDMTSVEVVINDDCPTFFVRLFNKNSIPIQVRAVAQGVVTKTPNPKPGGDPIRHSKAHLVE